MIAELYLELMSKAKLASAAAYDCTRLELEARRGEADIGKDTISVEGRRAASRCAATAISNMSASLNTSGAPTRGG